MIMPYGLQGPHRRNVRRLSTYDLGADVAWQAATAEQQQIGYR